MSNDIERDELTLQLDDAPDPAAEVRRLETKFARLYEEWHAVSVQLCAARKRAEQRESRLETYEP